MTDDYQGVELGYKSIRRSTYTIDNPEPARISSSFILQQFLNSSIKSIIRSHRKLFAKSASALRKLALIGGIDNNSRKISSLSTASAAEYNSSTHSAGIASKNEVLSVKAKSAVSVAVETSADTAASELSEASRS